MLLQVPGTGKTSTLPGCAPYFWRLGYLWVLFCDTSLCSWNQWNINFTGARALLLKVMLFMGALLRFFLKFLEPVKHQLYQGTRPTFECRAFLDALLRYFLKFLEPVKHQLYHSARPTVDCCGIYGGLLRYFRKLLESLKHQLYRGARLTFEGCAVHGCSYEMLP